MIEWLFRILHGKDRRRRQLLQLFLYKSFVDMEDESLRNKGGVLWWLVDPILQMGIYYLVFAVMLHRGGDYFVAFLLIGLISWRWFQDSLAQGANALLAGRLLLLQVKISATFFPSVTIVKNALKFAFSFLMLLLFIWIYGLGISTAYLALPVVLITQFLLVTGCVYVSAAIVPFLPDLRVVLTYILRALMFVSGVFYDGDKIPEHLQFWFYLNPIASLLKAYRDILIHGALPNWGHMLGIALLSLVLVALGKYMLAKYNHVYSRVVM